MNAECVTSEHVVTSEQLAMAEWEKNIFCAECLVTERMEGRMLSQEAAIRIY